MSKNLIARRRARALAAACMISAALPATAGLAKEKVKTDQTAQVDVAMDYAVSIPTIDAVGSNLDNAVLTDILSGKVVENADALANLDATSITVPEIVINVSSQSGSTSNQTKLTITGLTLEDVVDGRAAKISLAGVALAEDDAKANFGAMSAANLDIAGILGI